MTIPALGSVPLVELWNQSDEPYVTLRNKILLGMLDRVIADQSALVPRFGKGKPMRGPIIKWMEEVGKDSVVTAQLTGGNTLTISGYLRQEAVTEELVLYHARVGTIFERQSDGTQVKASAVTGVTDGSAPWALTVSEHGYTASGSLVNDDAATEWFIVSEPWSDITEVEDTRVITRKLRKCGTQIFLESFEILKSMENTAMEVVQSEYKHQMNTLTDNLMTQFGNALLRGVPQWDGSKYIYGDESQTPVMTGLWGWAKITQSEYANTNVFKNLSGAPITKTHIDDLARYMWVQERAKFEKGNWVIACHPDVHQFISDFDQGVVRETSREDKGVGFYVNKIVTKIGKEFPLVPDLYMRPGVLQIVNPSKFESGDWAGDTLSTMEIPVKHRGKKWAITFQKYGLVARSPRQNLGTLYNIATS